MTIRATLAVRAHFYRITDLCILRQRSCSRSRLRKEVLNHQMRYPHVVKLQREGIVHRSLLLGVSGETVR